MKYFLYLVITLYTFIFLGIFNSSILKAHEFNYNAKNFSDYFSGLSSFSDLDYKNSKKFFKNLKGLENQDTKYSSKFIQSLVNLEEYDEAYKFSKKLEKNNQTNFESKLILGLYEFKLGNYKKAEIYFNNLNLNFEHSSVFPILKPSLKAWTKIATSKKKQDIELLNPPHPAYNNLQLIQKTLANCFINNSGTLSEFKKIINDEKVNFSRYNFFYSNFLVNNRQKQEGIKAIKNAYENFPGNLLISQFKKSLEEGEKNNNVFECKNASNVLAEAFYIISSALSSQMQYKLSNFYLNLAKFLNPNFISFNTLIAENFLALKKYKSAKEIYTKLEKGGSIYKWYSAKKIAAIMDDENNINSTTFLYQKYNEINPGVYETFDLANFLRNKEEFKKSINLYSEVLLKIKKDNKLFPMVLERRGMAYEQNDQWDLAEKDLILSLKILPDEPYVMNYLAYSWVEKNHNTAKALDMLKKANDLKKNDGYITDSLGWALYKLKNYSEAKKYLTSAIKLMPLDPVINDHYGDCLWMNNKKIQARYYWKNVIKSDKADKDLKKKAEKKLLFGL